MNPEKLGDDAFLQALVTGELAQDAPGVQERFARQPALAADYRALLALQGHMDRAALAEGTLRGEAEATPLESEPLDPRSILDSASAPRPLPSLSRRRWWIGAGGGAAAALLAWWALPTDRAPNPRPGPHLGPDSALELLAPKGPLADFSTFRWSSRLDGPIRFRLIVRSVPTAGSSRTLLDVSAIADDHYTIPAATMGAWTDTIIWELIATTPDGRERGRGMTEASR